MKFYIYFTEAIGWLIYHHYGLDIHTALSPFQQNSFT